MDAVLRSFEYCLDYLREQVADVSNGDMVAQPNGLANHPAWVIGHLTHSCQALGGEIDLPPWLPEWHAKRFGTGSIPLNDPAAYDSKSVLLDRLQHAQMHITAAIQNRDSVQLDQPLPDARYRTIMPTVRDAITQVLVAHAANHVGQITIWRRLMGFGPLLRPFL